MPSAVPPPSRPVPRSRRSTAGWVNGPRRNNSIRIGIIGTILVHLLLMWLAPLIEKHMMDAPVTLNDPVAAKPTFDIEIMPVAQEPPSTYVDANPDAPDNPPDETDHFSDRNQQLAQEKPAEEEGDMPSTVGKEGVESTSIVSGDDAEPTPPSPPAAPTTQTDDTQVELTEEEQRPALAQDPLTGTEKIVGDSESGIGTNVVKLAENPTPDVDEKVEGITDPDQASPEGKGIYFRPNPNRPAARPTLDQTQLKPAIFENRVTGTQNIGVAAHEALQTTYGSYLAKMLEVIRQSWYNDIQNKKDRRMGFPLEGSKVTVWFFLQQDGSVTIEKVDGNAGQLWDGTAVEAIAAPARISDGFGQWTDDMRVVLGEKTPIRITFFYQ